ncbi:MAG: HDOD domain-containing protein [Bryobacteraceae bacterium]
MAWFESKTKRRTQPIPKALEQPTAAAAPILDQDENAATPVEGPNLGKLARLCPFSPVAISLLRLFDREDVELQEIVRLVASDATLATETLAYVNSPLFAVRESITDLQHAIVVLGANNVKSLSTTLAMRAMLKSAPKPAVVRRLWRHSIATAMIATELAPVYEVAPNLASTAGVLHDVGRIGLLAQYGEEYTRLVLSLYDDVDSILQAERATCALDHCDVGMYLGMAWKLPAVFQEVASKHHQAKGQTGVLGVIHVACAMADDMGFSAVPHRQVLTLEERVVECVPEGLRAQVKATRTGSERRIIEKIEQLDF